MIRLIPVLWTLGWKLTEIICAHTLVFDLAELTGFHDKLNQTFPLEPALPSASSA